MNTMILVSRKPNRKYRALVSTILACAGLLSASPSSLAAPGDPFRPLVRAFEQQREVDLRRAVARIRPAALIAALRGTDRTRVLATAAAAPWARQSWLLLDPLIDLMRGSDTDVAAAAAGAARAIGENLRPDELDRGEHHRDLLRESAEHLFEIASTPDQTAEIRSAALLILAQLSDIAPIETIRLFAFLADPDAEVRLAAVELFAIESDPSADEQLALCVLKDADAAVARAAAAVLCSRPPREPNAASTNAMSQIQAAATALESTGVLPRIRVLARDPGVPADERIDLQRCLRLPRRGEITTLEGAAEDR